MPLELKVSIFVKLTFFCINSVVMATSTVAAHPAFRSHSCKAHGFMDTNTPSICPVAEDQDASGTAPSQATVNILSSVVFLSCRSLHSQAKAKIFTAYIHKFSPVLLEHTECI